LDRNTITASSIQGLEISNNSPAIATVSQYSVTKSSANRISNPYHRPSTNASTSPSIAASTVATTNSSFVVLNDKSTLNKIPALQPSSGIEAKSDHSIWNNVQSDAMDMDAFDDDYDNDDKVREGYSSRSNEHLNVTRTQQASTVETNSTNIRTSVRTSESSIANESCENTQNPTTSDKNSMAIIKPLAVSMSLDDTGTCRSIFGTMVENEDPLQKKSGSMPTSIFSNLEHLQDNEMDAFFEDDDDD